MIFNERIEEGMKDFILMFRDIVKFGHQQQMAELVADKTNDPFWNYIIWALLKTISKHTDITLLPGNEKKAEVFFTQLNNN